MCLWYVCKCVYVCACIDGLVGGRELDTVNEQAVLILLSEVQHIIGDPNPCCCRGGRMLTITGTDLGYIQHPQMFAFVPMEGGGFYPTESTVSTAHSKYQLTSLHFILAFLIWLITR